MSSDNPFEPTRFAAQAGEPVIVNTSLTRTMGTISIVFGTLLLLCGLCSGAYVGFFTALGPSINAQMQQEMDKQREERIANYAEQEKTAVDEEARQEIAKQRAELEAQPNKAPNLSKIYGMGDSRVATYMGVDIISALVLNVLLLVSGIGLLGLKSWARKLGVFVAVVKIVRLVAIYSFFVFAIVPLMVGQMMEALDEIAKQDPNAQQMPPQVATGMGTMWTAYAVGMVVFGVIFPALCWYFLTRPGVKAACELGPQTEYQ
jgi:hypothetical protein